jgi:hypothetical protein
MKSRNTVKQVQNQEYEICFLVKGQSEWSFAHSFGDSEQSAIATFLRDFRHGTLVAVLAHSNDETSLREFKKLFTP